MTTNPDQQQLVDDEHTIRLLQAAVELQLRQIKTWTALPTERADWELETLLDDLQTSALALRRLRGERDLPF